MLTHVNVYSTGVEEYLDISNEVDTEALPKKQHLLLGTLLH